GAGARIPCDVAHQLSQCLVSRTCGSDGYCNDTRCTDANAATVCAGACEGPDGVSCASGVCAAGFCKYVMPTAGGSTPPEPAVTADDLKIATVMSTETGTLGAETPPPDGA